MAENNPYPIIYSGDRDAPVLAPAQAYGITGEGHPVVPAAVPSDSKLDTPLSAAGAGGFNPPPTTRYEASGSSVGSTATVP